MRNKFLLLLLLVLSMMVFTACQDTPSFIPPTPETVEIVNFSGTTTLSIGEDIIELGAIVYPTGAKQQVTWSSDNPTIATITDHGVVSGLAVGIATIRVNAIENTSIDATFIVTVVDDTSDLLTISGIINTLNELIPDEINSDMALPTTLEGATITWASSDYTTINRNGKVTRNRFDQEVELEATIKLSRSEGVFQKNIMVKAYPLKDISNRKVAFTYLFNPNFTGFREGDLDRIDVINYSFGGINSNRVSINGLTNLTTIMEQAHAHGVRVVLAIGGWGVDGFSQACSTAESRTTFIDSIMETIQKNRFDGIDIDWEYPTSTAGGLIAASPYDKNNLTAFMQSLKVAMNEYDPSLILSMAVAAGTYAASNYYNISALGSVIDYLHIMTYDMINYSTYTTTHHTNLYPSANSTFSVSQAVETYFTQGMPKAKIVVGVAFYGHVFKTTSAGTNGINATSGKTGKTTARYQYIVTNYLNNPLYTKYTDPVAMASWLYGEDTFISYDDPESIAKKCEYVLSEELAGLMVWEYCQDDTNSSLLKAIYDNVIVK